MLLIFLLIISLIGSVVIRFSVLDRIQPVVEKSHLLCLERLSVDTRFAAELRALVCAENFSSLGHSHFYISSGLIHLFVVSGAHLILIRNLLNRLPPEIRPGPAILAAVLILYAFACGMNPPIARALAGFLLGAWLYFRHIHWPPHFRILTAGLLTLIFHPPWLRSLGLQLSWLAALLVHLGTARLRTRSALFRQGLLYLALFPTLVFFQIPDPSVIVVNVILAPALELVLFPVALAVWFFHFLYPLFDLLIWLLKTALEKAEADYRFQLRDLPADLVLWNWAFILALHLVFHLLHVREKRRPAEEAAP